MQTNWVGEKHLAAIDYNWWCLRVSGRRPVWTASLLHSDSVLEVGNEIGHQINSGLGKTAQISTAWHQILNILYRVSPDSIITGWSYSIIHIQSLRFEPVPGRLRRSLSLLLRGFGLTAFLKPGCITALRFFCHPSRPKFATICQFAKTRSICRIRMEQISSLCSKMKWAFT